MWTNRRTLKMLKYVEMLSISLKSWSVHGSHHWWTWIVRRDHEQITNRSRTDATCCNSVPTDLHGIPISDFESRHIRKSLKMFKDFDTNVPLQPRKHTESRSATHGAHDIHDLSMIQHDSKYVPTRSYRQLSGTFCQPLAPTSCTDLSCLSRKHQSISVWMVKQWYPLTPIRPVHAPKSFIVFQGVSFFSWWKIVQRCICHCFPKMIQWQREFCHTLKMALVLRSQTASC